ncbi:DUF4282 domain-containing protein [candidate division KSB1 bacterium]|nr:DUF4282 domain-containing protein [candidate division KSB1 bacterium]
MNDFKKFLSTLFDFSFSEFIAPKIIKILYGIGIFIVALGTLGVIFSGFSEGFGKGIFMLVVSPIIFLIYAILVRVSMEIIIVLFRIYEKMGLSEEAIEDSDTQV